MRKNLLLTGIIFMLILMLVILTGCGDKKSNTNQNQEVENVTSNNEIQANKTGIEIKEIVQRFTDGIAVVKDNNNNQYAIDENGNVIVKSKDSDENVYYSNGYISVGNYIYDSDGKEITHDENKTYGNVSKSGYVSVVIKSEDVSGKQYIEQIEDLQGNKISDSYTLYSTDSDFVYLFEDFYHVYDRENEEYLLINAKNNEIKNLEEVLYKDGGRLSYAPDRIKKFGNLYLISTDVYNAWCVNSDFSKVTSAEPRYDNLGYTVNKIILDKYMIGKGNQGGNADEIRAFDLDGNMVKDFSEIGNVKAIEEYNNIIYIISETGYIYTMDENFNYIIQPEKTEYEGLLKCKDGIIATKDVGSGNVNMTLLDENLQPVKELATISHSYTSSDSDKFLYYDFVNSYSIYNLETNKELEIYE